MKRWTQFVLLFGLWSACVSAARAQSSLIEWRMEFVDGTTGAVASSFEQYNVRASTQATSISSTLDAAQLNFRWSGSGFNPNGLIVSDPDENGPTRTGTKARCAFGWDLTYNTAMQTPPATLTGRTDTAWAVFTFGAGIAGRIDSISLDMARIWSTSPDTVRFFLTWDEAGVKKTAYTSAIALGTPLNINMNLASPPAATYTQRVGSFAAGAYSGSTLPTGTALAGETFLLEVYAYGGTRTLEDDAQTADYNQRGYLHVDNLIVNGTVGACSTITVSPILPATGTVGSAYSQTFSATGGTAPYTYAVTSGTLPAGLTLNSSTGIVSGTPTASNGAGTSITVTATDTFGCTGARTATLKICPIISLAAISTTATLGTAYSSSAAATGGASPYVYAVTSGTLPAGLSLNTSTGALTGTPTSTTSATFTIRATDANTCAVTRSYTLAPVCPTITVSPATLTVPTVGTAYSQTVTPSGGTAPYTISMSYGALPAGLSFNASTGVISGTPTSSNAMPLRFTVTDAYGCQTIASYTLAPACTAVAISPTTLATGLAGTAYSTALSATPAATYNWFVSTGTLPPGLSLNGTSGLLSGTPTLAGNYSFTVNASSAAAAVQQLEFTTYNLDLNPGDTFNLRNYVRVKGSPSAPIDWSQVYFTYTAAGANDPTSPADWNLANFNAGTPVTVTNTDAGYAGNSGTGRFRIYIVRNGQAAYDDHAEIRIDPSATSAVISALASPIPPATCQGSRAYTMKVCPVITVGAITTTYQVGTAYSQTISAAGGTAPYTFAVTSGTLPTGLTLNASTGAIAGTPTSATGTVFTVTVTDASACTATRSYSMSQAQFDRGDFSGAGAATTTASSILNANLRLGPTVDAETSVTPNATATVDDTTNTGSVDDEDGVTMPVVIMTTGSTTIPVSVFNNATAGRYLHAWIDFNNDGTFTDTDVTAGGERIYSAVTPAAAAQQTINVTFTVPSGASIGTQRGARFRYSDSATTTPTSTGATGEIEDYVVQIAQGVAIGNLVWIDADNDGIKDATEVGEPGITVQLWTAGVNGIEEDGAGDDVKAAADIVTDINGNYRFGGLAAGVYYVRIPSPPVDFPVTSGVPDTADNQQEGDNNGRQPGGAGTSLRSPLITLSAGGEPTIAVDGDDANGEMTIDFGLASTDPCYTMNLIDNPSFEFNGGANTTGALFAALGYNGTGTSFGSNVNSLRWVSGVNAMSALNDPIQRMKVLAVGTGAKVAWVESARAHHGRRFMTLEGELSCVEVKPAGGGSWSSVLQAGKTYQFTVWADTASSAAASFELDLSASQPIYRIGSSGTQLHYYSATQNRWTCNGAPSSFAAGDYNGWNDATATVTQPNWRRYVYTFAISPTATAAQINSASLILSAAPGSGPVAIDDIMLCQPNLSIGNAVWADSDFDGLKEAGEPGLAGAVVQLFSPGSDNVIGGAVADTQVGSNFTTTSTGAYSFSSLAPGNYYVKVTPPAGYVTSGTAATADNNVDNNNDGAQPGGFGTALFSPVVNLDYGAESVTDGDSDSNSNNTVDFGLYACPAITVSPASLAAGTVGVAYSQTITTSGGTAPISLALTSGTMPSGLTFTPATGVISGTPTASNGAGVSLTFTATDVRGCVGTRTVTLKVCPVISLAALNTTLTVGSAYSSSSTASGGAAAYTYALTSGTLPAGLTLNTGTGAVTGTPTNTTSQTFTISATDANGCPGSRSYTLTPVCPAISITPVTLATGTVGSAYSQTLTATGGTAPYGTWTVTSGTLPAGLTLNASTGAITGTPTTANGTGVNITVRVNDTYGCQGTQTVAIKVCPVITLAPATLATSMVGQSYSQTVTASGGTAPYAYTVSSGALPAGLTIASATGIISGTPTTSTSASFTLTATDANGCTGSLAYTLTPVPVDFGDYPSFASAYQVASTAIYMGTNATDGETTNPSTGTANADDTTGTDDEDLTMPVVLVDVGALPVVTIPVTLSGISSGRIGAWIDWNGDNDVLDANETVTLSVANLVAGTNTITATLNPPAGTVAGTKYLRIRVTEGTTVPTFSGTSTLRGEVEDYAVEVRPPLVLFGMDKRSNAGLMAAESPVPVTYTAQCVTSQDLNLCSRSSGVQHNGLFVSDDGVPEGPLFPNVVITSGRQLRCASDWDTVFDTTLQATRTDLTPRLDTAPFTFTFSGVTTGTAITGFAMDYARQTGAPNQVQIFLTWHDGTAYRTAWTAPVTLPEIYYTASINGIAQPVSWRTLLIDNFTGGTALPTGAALSNETFLCEVYAWGGTGILELDNMTLLGTSVCATTDLGDWNGTGAATTSTTSVANSNLRLGATVDMESVVTPNAAATADDSTNNGSADDEDAVTMPASITQGASVTIPVSVFNNTGATAYLNAWIDFNNDGTFSDTLVSSGGERLEAARSIATGTSATTQNITFTVPLVSSAGTQRGVRFRLTNQAVTAPTGAVGSGEIEDYVVTISCPAITLSPASLAAATVGTAYSQTVTASGGLAPYSYAVSVGTLPAGLSLSTGGVISGTPTSTTSQTFTVRATDANGCTGTLAYTLAPVCPAITLNPATLPVATVGTAYSQSISATGGTAAYTYAVSAGTLPAGLTLSSAGVLSGTPTTANGAGVSVTIRATDNYGCQGTRAYTIKVCPVFTLGAITTTGTVGTAFSQTITSSGGVAPYTYAVTTGTLPTGLTLTSGGVLSGTPTVEISSTVTVTATDANGCPATRSYTLAMSCPPITVNPTTLPAGLVGTAYTSTTFSASGGTAPYTYSVIAGTLPAGLTLSSAGVLSGTPTASNGAGVSITVQAKDANNCPGTRVYTLKICPVISLAAISPTIVVGSAYSSSAAASGGAAPYVYALTSGTLPAGMSLNTTTGDITGTPTSSTAAAFTITATDANACTGSRAYTLSPTCPTITVSPTSLAIASVGVSYSQTMTAAGGTAPYTYTLTSGTLPAGLTLSSAGVVSGTPTTATTSAVTVSITARDANNCTSAATAVTISVKGLNIGNLVFIDMNNNGTRQTTESGVPNLTMQLWTPGPNGTRENGAGDDVKVGSDIQTDWNGAYQFTGLAPGSYYVRIPTPPVYEPSVSINGVTLDNGINNDSNAIQPGGSNTQVVSPVIALSYGTEPASGVDGDDTDSESTIDFGFANTDTCYAANLFDNPSFEIQGLPNVTGTGTAVLGYNGAGTSLGTSINSYRWSGGVSSGLGEPIQRVQVLPGAAGGSVAWTESAKSRHGKRMVLVQGSNSCVSMRAFGGGAWSTVLTAGSEYELVVWAANASAANASVIWDLGATSGQLFQIISGAAPGFYQYYSVQQSAMTGTPVPNFTAADYTNTSWTEATGNTAAPTWKQFRYRFRLNPTVTTAQIDSASFVVSGGTTTNPLIIDHVALCNVTPSATLSLGGTIWNDVNNNGLRGGTEIGVGAGVVTLSLFKSTNSVVGDADDVLQSTTATNGSGNYTFANLSAGNYYVQFTPPASLQKTGGTPVTLDNQTDNDNNGSQPGGPGTLITSPMIALQGGTESVVDGDSNPDTELTVDFGLWSGIALGNQIWIDANNNGLFDSGTDTVSGLTSLIVELLDSTGTIVTSTPVNASGQYAFTVFTPGQYRVRINTPPAAAPLVAINGVTTDNGTDNDNNGAQAGGQGTATVSPLITLAAVSEPGTAGTTNTENTIDIGFRTCPAFAIAPVTMTATQYAAFSQSFTTTGGVAPYTYSLATGSLPAGLTLGSSGTLSGTTTSAAPPGTYTFTVRSTDSLGCSSTQPVTMTIVCPPIAITPSTLPSGTKYAAYNQPLTATTTGTTGVTYGWSVAPAAPSGLAAWWPAEGSALSISSTANGTLDLGATTTASGVSGRAFSFDGVDDQVTVADNAALRPAAITIEAWVNPTYTMNTFGTVVNKSSTGSWNNGYGLGQLGNDTTFGFWINNYATNRATTSLTSGTWQHVVATYDGATIRLYVNGTQRSSFAYVAVINHSTAALEIGNGAGGNYPWKGGIDEVQIYNRALTAAEVTARYTAWTTGNDGMPQGLSLSASTGLLSAGSITSPPGVYNFNVRAADPNGCFAQNAFALTVVCPAITVTPATAATGTVGTAYSQTLSASGGTAPYTWSTVTGTWPAGLTLSSAGVISGTPTTANGTGVNVTARATDADGCVKDQVVSIKVCPVISLAAISGTITIGTAYSQTATASGGTAPYTYAVASGTLPSGLSLNTSTGAITGTPTNNASQTFTISVTDVNGCPGTRSYTLAPLCPAITVNPTTLAVGTVGSAYSQTLSASGGTAAYSFAVTSGTLPSGLTLNASTGVLSGTPTISTGAGASITITATDNFGCTGSRAYTLKICPVISLGSITTAGTVGTPYSQTLPVSGGVAPYTFAVTTGTLPAGLTLNTSTGVISGTPTAQISSTVAIRATDANGCPGASNYTLAMSCPPITVNPASIANGRLGLAYSQTVTASGGTAPYQFSVTAGTLPAGLTLTTAGVLSGTPTASNGAGVSITVQALDVYNCPGTRTYTIKICPVVTLAAVSTSAAVGTAYSSSATASGGAAPYTYAVASGALPAGLSLNTTTGAITGTPTSTTAATFTISATDANGCAGTQNVTITPVCPAITVNPATLAVGTVGIAYSQTATASGGTAPYTFAVSVGTLPAGLSLNATTGVISGTPTASNGAGTSITIRATDNYGCTGTRAYTLKVCPVITLGAISPTITIGTAYSQTVVPSGGVSPYTFALTSGTLPAGLTLNTSTGVISGTPSNSTAQTFTVTATDANGCPGSQNYSLGPVCPVVTVSPASLPVGTVGAAYSQTISASGGTAPYSFALTSGTLPAGLTFTTGGVLSGTPTTANGAGVSLTFTATDNFGCAGTRTVTLKICPVITLPALSTTVTVGTAYSSSAAASGGVAPYVYAVASGALPAGLSLNTSTGAVTGTPTNTTSQTFTLSATDANGCAVTRSYTLAPVCPVITVNPTTLPAGLAGSSYSQTLTAGGGTAPYAFTLTTGTLPAGLTLTSAGVLSGTPTSSNGAGVSLTFTATDSYGCTGTRTVTLKICPVVTLASISSSSVVGTAYNQSATASGGISPYVYALSSGALPSGLSLNTTTGVISGTPTNTTSQTFTISATDANGCAGTQSYTISPLCPTITVNPSTLPAGAVGTAYSQSLSANGGTTPYTFAVTGGTLPAGLTLTSAGLLSGTPTASNGAGVSITFTATDTYGCTGSRTVTLKICPVVSLPAIPSSLTVGTTYSQTIAATGGAAPYTYALAGGTLPAGLTLSSGGLLSGTPTSTTSQTFSVSATDANGCAGTRSYTLAPVCPAITVAPSTLPFATVGTAYSQSLSASGGNSPYTYALTAGVIPAGLTLTPSGILSGTPTASNGAGVPLTFTATDHYGCTGAVTITFKICPVLTLAAISTSATVGTAYSSSATASAGTAPYTYALSSGPLPSGLSLNATTGAITGTPTNTTGQTFSITATDANGCPGTRSYTLTPGCPAITVNPATLPAGTVGTAYSQTLSASGGTAAYSYAVTTGTLPAGLTLSSAGVLSGTPTTANGTGTSVTITATDIYGCIGSRAYTLKICPVISLGSIATTGTVGTPYSQTVTASGGLAPYTFSVSGGTLPAGLSLNTTTGAITGTPTAQISSTVTITATDANGCPGASNYTLAMSCPPITINPASVANGTIGLAYSQTLTASGGTAPYQFSVSSGTLPAGLTLSTAGVLSGTPTASNGAGVSITVQALDVYNCPGTRTYTIKICPVVTLAAVSTSATVGTAYSSTAAASGGATPYTYAVASGVLPAGLSLNTTTGAITGTPTSTATASFTISATDANGCPGSRSYTITPVCPTITLTPATLAVGTVGVAYSQSLGASGGTSPYAFTLTTGTLPAGLTVTSAGVISGTPTASNGAGVSLTFTATDNYGCTGTRTVTLKICPVITLAAISSSATVGTAYSQTATASGGATPYTYALASGVLPSGLSLNTTTGAITGTPTNTTSQTFTISATDANGCTGTRSQTISPVCPAITVNPSTLPAGTVGTAYSQSLSATGGTAPYAFTLTSGALPAGLTLTSAGVLSGTPTAANGAGVSLTFTATDNYGCTGTRTVTLKICPVLSLAAISASATVGTAYSQTATASGGVSPYTYALASGVLPAGLSLNTSTGAITGTPTTTTAQTFTISATDANGCPGTRSYTITPVCPAITVSPTALPAGTAGVAYSQTLNSTGGTAPYSYALTTGTLPAGLTLSTAGVISGTPAASNGAGVSLTFTATDNYGCTATRTVTLKICPVITLASISTSATVGTAFSQSAAASGGVAPYTYALASGVLPTGLSLNTTTGAVTGTPTNTTAQTFVISATDANGCVGTSASLTITPVCPVINVTPVTLATGTVGSLYSQTLSATGGTSPYTWTTVTGTWPAGLTLSTAGVLSGTPTTSNGAGVSVTVRATDTYGCFKDQIVAIKVCPVITVSPTSLAASTAGASYSQTITAGGGAAPYTFAVSSGTLPAGLTLNASTGVISGTPTSTATAAFTIRATDANACPGTRAYTITPACGTITLSPTTMAAATVGSAYSQTLTASGGVGPYTFAVSLGTLPAGLSLNAGTGVISGTPTSTASASFTIRATDANACQGTQAYTLAPTCPVLTLSPATLPAIYFGASYSQTFSTSGGTAPYSYSVTAGTLPTGLTLSTAGLLSGTSTATGTFTFTVRSTDTYGCNVSASHTVTIRSLTVGDIVFEDANNNGTRDAGEPGVAGALVQLFNPGSDNAVGGTSTAADTQVGTDFTTTSTGAYSFTGLPAGSYFIKVTPPADYAYTGGTPSTTDDNINDNNDGSQPGGPGTPLFSPVFALASGAESITDGDTSADTNLTIDFGLWDTVSVGNVVFFDLNADGTLDPAEGLEGVLVQIYTQGSTPGTSTPVSAAVTDNKGRYLIEGLNPGNYFLHLPASQFAAGMPLEGMIPMSSVIAGDDNVGQDLLVAATPASTGASTAVFSLRPALCPSGSSEPGFEGVTDDGTDTRVDLTRDLGLVNSTGTGFPSNSVTRNTLSQPAPSSGVMSNTLTAVSAPLTFASWSSTNSTGAADADADNDSVPNLLEYALGTDPRSGLLPVCFTLEADQATGTITALVTRPVEGRDDLRYTLETSATRATNTWTTLAMPAAATFNQDGTVTRRYVGIDTSNADLGFIRLRVDLDADRDGTAEASVTSPVHAWTHQAFEAGTRSFSMPLLRAAIYSGVATRVDDHTLRLPVDVTLDGPAYVELSDGRTIDVATVSAGVLELAAALPEAVSLSRITLRKHHTVGLLLPDEFFADDDRILAYDTRANTLAVIASEATLPSHGGLLVKVTGSGFTRSFVGEVREKAAVIPLVSGTQLITAGALSVNEVPSNSLQSSTTPQSADRLRLWNADQAITSTPYSSYFLSEGRWTAQSASSATQPMAMPFRAFFLIRSAPLWWTPIQPAAR